MSTVTTLTTLSSIATLSLKGSLSNNRYTSVPGPVLAGLQVLGPLLITLARKYTALETSPPSTPYNPSPTENTLLIPSPTIPAHDGTGYVNLVPIACAAASAAALVAILKCKLTPSGRRPSRRNCPQPRRDQGLRNIFQGGDPATPPTPRYTAPGGPPPPGPPDSDGEANTHSGRRNDRLAVQADSSSLATLADTVPDGLPSSGNPGGGDGGGDGDGGDDGADDGDGEEGKDDDNDANNIAQASHGFWAYLGTCIWYLGTGIWSALVLILQGTIFEFIENPSDCCIVLTQIKDRFFGKPVEVTPVSVKIAALEEALVRYKRQLASANLTAISNDTPVATSFRAPHHWNLPISAMTIAAILLVFVLEGTRVAVLRIWWMVAASVRGLKRAYTSVKDGDDAVWLYFMAISAGTVLMTLSWHYVCNAFTWIIEALQLPEFYMAFSCSDAYPNPVQFFELMMTTVWQEATWKHLPVCFSSFSCSSTLN